MGVGSVKIKVGGWCLPSSSCLTASRPMSGLTSIWTVVVTHNSEGVISGCLSSLGASSIETKLVVVDNASEDATVEIVEREFPSVLIVRATNLGFAGGCNRGVGAAGEEAEAYFFLNPDAAVETSCLEKLSRSLCQDEKLAVVSPKVVHPFGGETEYAGAALDFNSLDFEVVVTEEAGRENTAEVSETGRPAGAAMLVRRSSFEEVGPLDDSYFLYWEECEWASRVHRNGLKVGYVPDATVYHSLSHSTGGEGSRIYEYYYTRNLLRLVASVRGTSKLSTFVRLVPLFGRRLREIAYRRRFDLLATALRFDALGTIDFFLGRSGRRAGLPRDRMKTLAPE